MQSTIQQVKELGERVNTFVKRVDMLEKDSAIMTDASIEHSELLDSTKRRTDEEILQIHQNIILMKTMMKNVRIELDIIIGKLKDSVRVQEFENIKERVEVWALEKYATKLDLKEYDYD